VSASLGELRERAQALEVAPAAISLLIGRGVVDEEAQARWLRPKLADLRRPEGMAGFLETIDLLTTALRQRWRIGVFGDYDVDGVTTATILSSYLEALGGEVVSRVANRDSGYGFGVEDAKALVEAGVDLVVTGDCGTSDHEALGWLKERGIPSAVIDHHQVPEVMPPATALLNPHQDGCGFPFKGLCSAGVAFYLCAALRTEMAKTQGRSGLPEPRAWLDMVALGTVCDMVPLVDENRILVRRGLEELGHRRRPGLKALLSMAKVDDEEIIDESHLGFRLGPRLNAPGRLGPAEPSLSLLRARSLSEARGMAMQVETCNSQRRELQARIVAEAEATLAADPRVSERSGLVVAKAGWLHGIVGIAASTLVQTYSKPVLVLAVDEARGEARGSARTFGTVDVRAALRECAPMLRRFGGHKAAAGVSMDPREIPRFIEAFDAAVAAQIGDREVDSGLGYDGALTLETIDPDFLTAIESLGPYGMGFPAPRYLLEDAEVDHARILKGGHLKMALRQGGVLVDAIAFNQGDAGVSVGDRVNCLYLPSRSAYRGRVRLQLMVEAIWKTRSS